MSETSGLAAARATCGHVAAAPPSSVMNSRRLFLTSVPTMIARAVTRKDQPPTDANRLRSNREHLWGRENTASGLPDAVPATTGGDRWRSPPVPGQKASAHARVCDDAPSRLLFDGKHQRPELVLRRSITSLRTPCQRFACGLTTTRAWLGGRCGSLRLHRDGLAPSTFRRYPGAPVHSIKTEASFPFAPEARPGPGSAI